MEENKCILCDTGIVASEVEAYWQDMEVSVCLGYCPNMRCSRYGLVVTDGLKKPTKEIKVETPNKSDMNVHMNMQFDWAKHKYMSELGKKAGYVNKKKGSEYFKWVRSHRSKIIQPIEE